MELQHFSHEHPLILKKEQEKKDDEMICYGCGKAIAGSDLAYGCGECDGLFLHKACAEMPREMTHPMHSLHSLLLLTESPYGGSFICNVCCGKISKQFTYHCSKCEFDVCVICASILERRFQQHQSHQHPLMHQHIQTSFICHACGEEDKDASYICTSCPFWIHERCASLPRMKEYEVHDHPLSLDYSLPMDYRSFKFYCDVCGDEKVHPSDWVYYCGPCRFFVHLKCVTRSAFQRSSQSRASNLEEGELNFEEIESLLRDPFQLPTDNFDPVIRQFTKQNGRKNIKSLQIHCSVDEEDNDVQEHLPIIADVQNDTKIDREEIVCDCCIKPILSTKFYKCGKCQYNFHLACGKLPLRMEHPCHPQHQLTLGVLLKDARDIRKCDVCQCSSNGILYICEICNFRVDVKCASLPTLIAHEAHQHPLSLLQIEGSNFIECDACSRECTSIYFGCENCYFYLHYECAQLPPIVEHRSEKHPLILSFPPFYEHPDEFYCVVCEEELHPKYWLYHCRECDQSFHPRCIFKSGKGRNIALGRTLQIGNSHPHALEMVREANFHLSCNSCQESLHEEVCFACKSCLFYLCFSCVSKKS